MKPSRRDLLAFGGGAAAGLVFTPVPWGLLNDSAIWTQNWPWIPQPARAPVNVKYASCALCPHGCGLKIRMAEGWAVGLSGMPSHPVSQGALCPLGFGAHQLNWHPRRLRTVLHHGRAASWAEAATAFHRACAEGSVAAIDGRPGRAASAILKRFVEGRHGMYTVAVPAEQRGLAPYEAWGKVPASNLGYDLETAGTVVSFGAPLLDGWGTPGRFTRLWANRAAAQADPRLRLIQIEPVLSRTASAAWRWAAVRPESDAVLAGAFARVLLEEHLVAARGPMPPNTVEDAAARSGLTPEAIRDLARMLVAHGPVVAIPADYNPAVAALNVVLGAAGARGGIIRRSEATETVQDYEHMTGTPRALLIDATVPWDLPMPAASETFRFAAWQGYHPEADWVLPAPGFLEELTDVPGAPGAAVETYAVAPALVKRPSGVTCAAEFLAQADGSLGSVEDAIHTRCEQLFHDRAGMLHGPEKATPVPLAEVESAAKLREALLAGAVWSGDPPRRPEFRCELRGWPREEALPAHRASWTAGWPVPILPPLAGKIVQESTLRSEI